MTTIGINDSTSDGRLAEFVISIRFCLFEICV